MGCKDESPATRPFPSQKGKCISYMLSEALLLAQSTYDTQYSCLFITHIAVSNYHIFMMLRIQYPLNGKSATRSVAHCARGKRILNKQLVGNANSLMSVFVGDSDDGRLDVENSDDGE